MEIVIIVCLLIIIVLLLEDKIVIKKVSKQKPFLPDVKPAEPSIMGRPKQRGRLLMPSSATEGQKQKPAGYATTFDVETRGEIFVRAIPQEALGETFDIPPDFHEEEEEWGRHGEPNGEDGFATGVTFEELSTVGSLLQQEVLEPSMRQQAVGIVQKIQGTELFGLLENSIENASQKIARLLDQGVGQDINYASFPPRDNTLDGFDIGEFV